MKPVVLITVFKRPEFLHWCLERIKKAKYAEKMLYLFACDYGFDVQNIEVINKFPFEKIIRQRSNVIRGIGKQSYNVLEGYREASTLSDSFVFNIEDDIMISTEFFKWHIESQALNLGSTFCSIGTKSHNTITYENTDVLGIIKGSKTDYQSWGVCFYKKVLNELILTHASRDYYNRPNEYVIKRFPNSVIGKRFCEQDGLIRRIKEQSDLEVLFPTCPHAYHAGFYSYHRNMNKAFFGSLQSKIDRVGEILSDPIKYRTACENDGFYEDSKQCKLDF